MVTSFAKESRMTRARGARIRLVLLVAAAGFALASAGCRWGETLLALPGQGASARTRELSEWVQGPAGQWQEPLQLTTHPAEDSNADLSPDGRWLVFVSNRSGSADLWLQNVADSGLEPPVALTDHPAMDGWPRWAPDSRRIAFASRRSDAAGDIWVMTREGKRGSMDRLTDEKTADGEPTWFPDGNAVAFTSAAGTSEGNIYRKGVSGETAAAWLTKQGGFSCAVSPDGNYVVFVSRRKEAGGDLWVYEVKSRQVWALTAGPALDAFPCWSEDGKRVVLVRWEEDTDKDGRVTVKDTSSLWTVPFNDQIAKAQRPVAAFPLTGNRFSELFPALRKGTLVFTSNRGRGLDVWALPPWGELPRFQSLSEYVAFAKRNAAEGTRDNYELILAWRAVTAGARLAQQGWFIKFDLGSMQPVAEAQLEIGRLYLALGLKGQGETELRRVLSDYKDNEVVCGLAELELERMARQADLDRKLPPAELRRVLTKQKERLTTLYKRFAGGKKGPGGERNVAALALVETARSDRAMREYADALEQVNTILKDFAEERAACAQALLIRADIYKLLNDPKALTEAYLRILKEYGDLAGYKEQATSALLSAILRDDMPRARKLELLRGLVETYKDRPYLQAMAQNRIGDLFYEARESGSARTEYERTIDRFKSEPDAVARARLSIARIDFDQKSYGTCVAQYREVLKTHGKFQDRIYFQARRAYLNGTMEKAARELDLRDPRLAMATYKRVIDEFDKDSVRAHRGWIDCLARLNELDQAIRVYNDRLEKNPKDDLAYYGLARAYSYLGPSDWVGNASKSSERRGYDREAVTLCRRALLLKAQVPYYHQLLGFLYERLARASTDTQEKSRHESLALESYITALSLSDPEEDPTNHADLVFNVAEGFQLLGNETKAYEYYRKALAVGLQMNTQQRKTIVYTHTGDSAIAAQEYDFAAQQLLRALKVLEDEPEPKKPEEKRQLLIRKAEMHDRLSLTYRLNNEFVKAVAETRAYLKLLDEITALPSTGRQEGMYDRNRLRAYRNLGLNLYRAVEAGQADESNLAEAKEALQKSLKALSGVGVVKSGGGKSSLIQVSLGGGSEFDENTELRLLHTYLARIYARAGNYPEAIKQLREKLTLYGRQPSRPKANDPMTIERAILISQIGLYHIEQDDPAGAFKAFKEARGLDRKVKNSHGEVVNTVNMGASLLRILEDPTNSLGREEVSYMLADATGACRETMATLAEPAVKEKYGHPDYVAKLNATFIKLTVMEQRTLAGQDGKTAKRSR